MGKKVGLDEIEKQTICEMTALGKSANAIGQAIKRDGKTVRKFLDQPQALAKVIEERKSLAEKFESMSDRMLTSIKDEDIERLNAYQRVISSGICLDKARLLSNQSTQNIELIIQQIREIKAQE